MTYSARKKPTKFNPNHWAVKQCVYKNGKPKWRHVPVEEYSPIGLHTGMSLEQARAACSAYNAEVSRDKEEHAKVVGSQARVKKSKILQSIHLPEIFVTEFTSKILKDEMDVGARGEHKYKKALSTWQTVQKLIVAIDLPVNEWFDNRRRIYNYFRKNKVSPSYTGKILRILNLWGSYYGKRGRGYTTVPPARGNDREEIADAYLEDETKRKKTSEPLLPEVLMANESKLKPAQFRWLYCTVWLGLRPTECDNLKDSKITPEQGVNVLWVYQSKLRGIKKEDRYKPIPLIFKEQLKCLEYLKQGLERPLVKTIQLHLDPKINLYGGRKGFTDLCLSRGQALEDISIWLGHATIDRTWHNYKRRQRVSFRKVS